MWQNPCPKTKVYLQQSVRTLSKNCKNASILWFYWDWIKLKKFSKISKKVLQLNLVFVHYASGWKSRSKTYENNSKKSQKKAESYSHLMRVSIQYGMDSRIKSENDKKIKTCENDEKNTDTKWKSFRQDRFSGRVHLWQFRSACLLWASHHHLKYRLCQ